MSSLVEGGIAIVLGATVSALTCPALIRILVRHSVVDEAGIRSSHTGSIPRGGGVAIMLGSAAGFSMLLRSSAAGPLKWAVPFALLLGGLGLIDDVRTLSARHRLLAQTSLATAFVLASGVSPVASARWAGAALAVLWLVGFVNAFNFMDGINGISVGTAVVIAGSLSLSSARWGSPTTAVAAAALLGAVAGFAPFNLVRARLFMGDVGSYFVGGALALLALVAIDDGVAVLAACLPFTLYVADVACTLFRRIRRRENLATPHREHTYQLLANGGWGHLQTTLFVTGMTLVLAAVGQLAGGLGGALAIAVAAAGILVVPIYLLMPSHR
ncbi:MAG: glycosyl transferase [Actinomycetia bacterium]|nr:glycosyl transferase [Actinomycetes bacterium]